jgi:hypothetical protein
VDVLNFLHRFIKKTRAHKKARPDFSGAGCEVQGNLEELEN